MKEKLLSKLGWIVSSFLFGFLIFTSSTGTTSTDTLISNFKTVDSPVLVDFNGADLMDPDFQFEEIVDRPNMIDPCLGEISIFTGNFAPVGWAQCNGQLLPISQHQALFSILGCTYGGDCRTTFGLPDLRGRTPIHEGSNGGRNFVLGAKDGSTTTPLDLVATNANAAPTGSSGNVNAVTGLSLPGGNSRTTLQPFNTLNYIIALQGTFCSRN